VYRYKQAMLRSVGPKWGRGVMPDNNPTPPISTDSCFSLRWGYFLTRCTKSTHFNPMPPTKIK
jgi:hypothetical protein